MNTQTSEQYSVKIANASRIASCFDGLKAANKRALIPYVTAGYPSLAATPALMHAMVQAGADIIELGVPFSDPSADGPVIQRANERALAQGVRLDAVLNMVTAFRQTNTHTPVVLMGYANPIERFDLKHGENSFIRAAKIAGVDGLLVVDYPPEECVSFAHTLRTNGMDLVFLLAPTSTDTRIQSVAKIASGYVYYVSIKGTTGAAAVNAEAVAQALPRIRQHVHIPVGVGFGIRDAASAKAVGAVADAVVIGSKIIQLLEAAPSTDAGISAVASFLQEVRHALDAP